MEQSKVVIIMYNKIRMIMNSGTVLAYFLQAVPIACAVGVVFIVARILFLKAKNRKIIFAEETIKTLFACYVTGLLSLVVLPVNFWLKVYDGIFFGWWGELGSFFSLGEFNLVPAIVKIMKGELMLGSWVKEMLVGNILMFVPFGFFLPFITKKASPKNIFLTSAAVPLAVEVFQLVLGRSFDVDDLICNFVGIMGGYFVAFALKSIRKPDQKGENLWDVR